MLAALLIAFGCFYWDAVPDADSYRVLWSSVPTAWSACQSVEVTGTTCLRDDLDAPVVPTPEPGGLLFIVIQACNEEGCSDTGHGPVEECPP